MASNFDANKYRETFEKRVGSGSYESGLSKARDIGRAQANAVIAKADYNDRKREAEKAANKKRREQEKVLKEKAKEQKKKDEEQAVYDLLEKNKKANEDNSFFPKKIAKPFKNVLENVKDLASDGAGVVKGAIKSANPFDDISFGDAMLKNAMEFDKKKSKTFDEVERFTGRAVNSSTLGLMGNIDKKMRDGETPHYLTKRKFGEGGGTDMVSDLLGYAVPGVGIAKGLKGTALGAKGTKELLSKEITKASAKKIATQTAKEGAAVGGIMAGTEIAGREALNPDDSNWKQNLGQFGLEVGAGAVLDPALTLGAAKLLSKIKKPPTGKNNSPDDFDDFDDISDGPTPFDVEEPTLPGRNEVAATTSKPRQRYDIDTLMKSYKGQDVSDSSTPYLPSNNNFAKQADSLNTFPNKSMDANADKLKDGEKVTPVNNNVQAYKDLAEDSIANSELWKDKGPLFYGRETLERNFEDIAGYADGHMLKDNYVQPVRQKETERIRFVNDKRDVIKSFGIKPKSQEDKLTQMFGEGKIDLDNLKKETPNWKKVKETADWYRGTYDKLITTVNKVLADAGEKTIPVRENYFPHYQEVEGIFAKLQKAGFNVDNHTLPTGINGLTENFKPNKKFFSHSLQRKTDETTFGAMEGFDRYIEGVSQIIYHTENIKKMRALEDAVRNKHGETTHLSNLMPYLKEYGNLQAGKKAATDRVVEEKVGRWAYNGLDTLKQKTGMNMLGYSVGSASTALIPLTHALATTSKKAFTKGMLDTITNIVRKDGFADKSDFLTRRVGSQPLVRTNWNKIENNSMVMMDLVDRFTSQTIVRGKYNELLEKGLPEDDALKQADDWAGRIMADRSKGQQPTMFASKTLGPINQFMVEVNNQISFIFKDIPKNAKNKAQLASHMTQLLVYSYLANEVYEQVLGRRPAFDPAGVAVEAYRNFSDSEMDSKEATGRLLKDVAGQLPFTSTFTGGRYPIKSAIPSVNIDDYANNKTTIGKELMKPLKYLVLPTGGSQISKTYGGNKILNEGGVYKNDKLKYPVENSLENQVKGLLLGKGSFDETREHYDQPYNKRRALTEKQTAKYEEANARGVGKEFFDYQIEKRGTDADKRTFNKAKKEIKKIQEDETLTDKQRKERIEKALKLLELK